MRILLVFALVSFLVLAGFAQTPKIDGPWYGTINPPGARFDIAVNFRKKANGWTGTLLRENGVSTPLTQIEAEGNSVAFSLDAGGAAVAFKVCRERAERQQRPLAAPV